MIASLHGRPWGRFLAVLLVLLAADCSGDKKARDDAAGPDDAASEQEGGEDADDNLTMSDLVSYTPERRREVYARLPEGALGSWDRINKCELDGACTAEEAARQKLCAFLDHPCLEERFRVEEEVPPPCGVPQMEEIRRILHQFPNLFPFYESLLSEPAPPAPGASRTNGLPFVRAAGAQSALPFFTEVTTLDGQYSFQVLTYEMARSALRQINQRRTVTAPGGRTFDIFFRGQDSDVADAVEACLMDSWMWSDFEEIFRSGINLRPFPGHQNPTIFVPPAIPERGTTGYFMPWMRDKGYIVIPARVRGRGSSGASEVGYWSFLRGPFLPPPSGFVLRDVATTCRHELYHAIENVFLSGAGHPFEEALAEWFAYLRRNNLLLHYRYPAFLYTLDQSFWWPEPELRPYGAVHLWNFLSYRVPADPLKPVRSYVHHLANTPLSFDALHEALKSVSPSGSPIESLGAYALSTLNLKDPPEGVLDIRDHDLNYQDHYLVGTATGGFFHLPDVAGDRRIDPHQRMVILEPDLNALSITYIPLVAFSGETFHNTLMADCDTGLPAEGSTCHLLAFKINKEDRSQYELLFSREQPQGGGININLRRFTDPDREPELLLFILVNGTNDRQRATISVGSQPFSAPVPFELENRKDRVDPESGNYDRSWAKVAGYFAEPEPSEPPELIRWGTADGYPFPVTFGGLWRSSGVDPRVGGGLVPFHSAIVSWQVDRGTFSGGCPAPRIETRERGPMQSLTLNPEEGSLVHFDVRGDEGDPGTGRYSFGVALRPSPPIVTVPFTRIEVCHDCCAGFVPRAPEAGEQPLNIGALLRAMGSYSEPFTSLTLTSEDDEDVFGTITFSEPVEVPRHLEQPGRSFGGLVYNPGGRLGWQLVPPIIDYVYGQRGPE